MTKKKQAESLYRCEDAVLDIIRRIQAQQELKDVWNGMCCAEKNYITGDFYNIVEKASHSALQQVPAPDAEDFETALKCFGHCGSECQVECSLKSCCIQAQAIAAAAIKQERERICEAVAELNEGDQFHLPIGRILAIIDNGGK